MSMFTSSSQLPKSFQQETENEQYFPLQVDTYLNSLNDWRNVQDIIRSSLKALADTVRSQGQAIRDLEKDLQSKASKSELTTSLSSKASSTELMRAISDISNSLESRITADEMHQLMKDKVSKSELLYYLNSKPSTDDVRNMLDEKVDIVEYNRELNELTQKVDEFQNSINKKIMSFASAKDMQNIQSVLTQKANLTEVNESLNLKANKDTVLSALQKKANKIELDALGNNKVDKSEISQIMNTLGQKANASDMEGIEKLCANKVDKSTIDGIIEAINKKAEGTDFKLISDAFQEMKSSMTKRIDDIDQDFDRLIENIKAQFQTLNIIINNLENNKIDFNTFDKITSTLQKKVDNDKIDKLLIGYKNDMFDMISTFKSELTANRKKIDDKINERISIISSDSRNILNDLNYQKETLTKLLTSKSEEKETLLSTVKNVFNNSFQDIHRELFTLKESLSSISSSLNAKVDTSSLEKLLSKLASEKASVDSVNGACRLMKEEILKRIAQTESNFKLELSRKISVNEIKSLISDKVNRDAVEGKVDIGDFEKIKIIIDKLNNELTTKIDIDKFELSIKNIQSTLEDMNNQMQLKANVKEMFSLLKNKANVDDVNKALVGIHEEMDEKTTHEQFANAMDNQALINDALCAENCLGRWMWKSGKVRNGYAVPWEVQSANTAPDNFLWEKDRTFIIIAEGGLYEVSMAFFADRKPAVQLMVNGEVVVSTMQQSGSVKGKGGAKGGNVNSGGQTNFNLNYLMIPDKAKISVSYSGEDGGIGFMGVKKL